MFFGGWETLLRVLVLGVLAYVALVLLLVTSGKRTLSKMNSFDFVVTVALGSTLATVLLSRTITLAEGVLAFAVLIGLQFAITWLSVRSSRVSHLVKLEPTMLFYRGEFLWRAMHRERVTESEILQAMREKSIASQSEVEAVVLETSGELSVVKRSKQATPSALANVSNLGQHKAA
jgi:uncharacterized membrane protein YcaP (DUF421 family)